MKTTLGEWEKVEAEGNDLLQPPDSQSSSAEASTDTVLELNHRPALLFRRATTLVTTNHANSPLLKS